MKLLFLTLLLGLNFSARSAELGSAKSFLDDFDPSAPNAEEILKKYDRLYEEATGESAFDKSAADLLSPAKTCYRQDCSVWAYVNKARQQVTIYHQGKSVGTWPVSTGAPGFTTPDFDRHPNGRMYRAYTSSKYPGGDYNGLGNMPYAVFIRGGYALHGTPQKNWAKLGSTDSHGCIRMHPDVAKWFYDATRYYGVTNVWITVQ